MPAFPNVRKTFYRCVARHSLMATVLFVQDLIQSVLRIEKGTMSTGRGIVKAIQLRLILSCEMNRKSPCVGDKRCASGFGVFEINQSTSKP